MGPPQNGPIYKYKGEMIKKFRIQISAYKMYADFIIESLDLYHEKVIKLKPTKVSRKFDNNVSDERIKREMEEWAAAMGVPMASEGQPIEPVEEPIDGPGNPLSRPWNPLESIELDDNDDPLF